MTSEFATNSKALSRSLYGHNEYLKVIPGTQTPIEDQIPHTYTLVEDVSGTFVDTLPGTDFVVIEADLTAGNAIYQLSAEGYANMIGRTVAITCIPSNAGGARTVSIQLPGDYFCYQGAAAVLATNTLTFPVTVVSVVRLTFADHTHCIVEGDVATFTFA